MNSLSRDEQRAVLRSVKNVTGLTWEQLALPFGMSPRTFRYWSYEMMDVSERHTEFISRLDKLLKHLASEQRSPVDARALVLAELNRERSKYASREDDINRPPAIYSV